MAKELTEKQQRFIDVFMQTKSIKVAAQEAEYSNPYTAFASVKQELIERLQTELVKMAPEAIEKLQAMLSEGATEAGAVIRMDAIKQILDRIGIVKKEKFEIEGLSTGVFVIPAKNIPLLDIPEEK